MNIVLSILGLVLHGAPTLEALPHSPGSDYAFVAALEEGEAAAIVVLGAAGLYVYPEASRAGAWHRALDGEVSAFDLYDIDDDGALEAVWIQGKQLYACAMTADATPRVLFSMEAPTLPDGPFPQVLVRDTEEGLRFMVPSEKRLLEYGLDGALHREHSLDAQSAGHAMLGAPFRAWTPLQAVTGSAGSLEIHGTRVQALKPALEEFATALDPALVARRSPTPQQLAEAGRQESVFWPWFPLEQREPEERPFAASRVYYAVDGVGAGGDTLVRVWRRSTLSDPEGGEGLMTLGPVRRYPGLALPPPSGAADFNGDGYNDLMTWRAPQPAPTADSLARAITRGTWPATLSVHLYMPENERFAARAAARIEVELPINWFLSGFPPFQLLQTDDLSGDGKSEVLFALSETRLGVWRLEGDRFVAMHGAGGIETPEPLQRHIATAPPGPEHGGSVVFAGEEQFWVLGLRRSSP